MVVSRASYRLLFETFSSLRLLVRNPVRFRELKKYRNLVSLQCMPAKRIHLKHPRPGSPRFITTLVIVTLAPFAQLLLLGQLILVSTVRTTCTTQHNLIQTFHYRARLTLRPKTRSWSVRQPAIYSQESTITGTL